MNEQKPFLYQNFLKLVGIPSVSPSSQEENRMARAIVEDLGDLDYFKANQEDLRLFPVEGDPLERHIVFAVVRAAEKTDNTVILTGHLDVVSADSYGALRDLAFSPEEYTSKLDPDSLPADARKDLLSGDWLFGRGVADMKSGISAGVTLLAEASRQPEGLKANLAVLFVPDEENNSEGMLGAVPWLVRLQEEGFRFVGCINTEPTFANGEESHPTVYLGSIGKINPFFFCLGRETHVGEYYEGFSAGGIATQIHFSLDGNVDFSDSLGDIAYPPFACLKIRDLRTEYSATILSRCGLLFSYLTATRLPGKLMDELKGIAKKALDRAIERHERNRRAFYFRNRSNPPGNDLKGRVMAVRELVALYGEKTGRDPLTAWEGVLDDKSATGDIRDRALEMVSRLVDELELEGPLVVVGFLPPWYPHRANPKNSEGERVMAKAAEDLCTEAARTGLEVDCRPFFEGVCDLSYCGFTGDLNDVAAFEENMPGGKKTYRFPSEDLLKLNIPVVNFGPVGKDAHRKTERINLPFYLEKYPVLLRYLVDRIAESSEEQNN